MLVDTSAVRSGPVTSRGHVPTPDISSEFTSLPTRLLESDDPIPSDAVSPVGAETPVLPTYFAKSFVEVSARRIGRARRSDYKLQEHKLDQ
jgi:hypothetical protein